MLAQFVLRGAVVAACTDICFLPTSTASTVLVIIPKIYRVVGSFVKSLRFAVAIVFHPSLDICFFTM